VERLDAERYFPVVVLGSNGEFEDRLRQAGIETHVIPLAEGVANTRKDTLGRKSLLQVGKLLGTLTYARSVARFIKQRRVDFVHTNSLKADIIGGVAARLAGVPVIWHVRDRIENDYLPAPAVRAFRYLCRVVPDFIIVNSAATLKTLRLPSPRSIAMRRGNPFRSRGFVVHNGVVHDGVPAGHYGPDRLKGGTASTRGAANRGSDAAEQTPTVNAPLVGLVGRISPWKGQHVFVEAAGIVRERFPEARFQIVGSAMFGETEYERQVRDQVASLGLEECVEFTGFRSDVPELVDEFDVLVHASTTGEPFGQVIAEGMAAGKPVVATDGGAVPEIVQDGVTGILVPMGQAAPMAEAILRLLENPEEARAMGVAGAQRIEERFTMSHVVEKVEKIYDDFWDWKNSGGRRRPRLV
jgi:glycosyltransferase involved in cell wall biosynthesis